MNKFHRVYGMFAWNTGREIFLYIEDDLRELILHALKDRDKMLRYMSIIKVQMGSQKSFNKLSAEIDRKLKKAQLNFPKEYTFTGKEAQSYIRDFLEVFKFKIKRIIWDEIEGRSITIKVYSKPYNLWNRICGTMPPQLAAIEIPYEKIDKLAGTATEFVITTKGGNYTFSPHGVTW